MIMKKILLFISLLAISTNSFANTEREGFYLRGGVGVNKLLNAKENIPSEYRTPTPGIEYTNGSSFLSKSLINPIYSMGGGYYIDDVFRVDVELSYADIKFKQAKLPVINREDDDISVFVDNTLKRHSSLLSVFTTGYVDWYIDDNTSLFLGAGVGIAKIQEKVNVCSDSITYIDGEEEDRERLLNSLGSSKQKINLAYSLTIGASHKITDNAHLELAYSWKDYGKTHPKLDYDEGERANRYRGHHVGVGLRFDI
jgi:opacity protein-like surface antigen